MNEKQYYDLKTKLYVLCKKVYDPLCDAQFVQLLLYKHVLSNES